MLRRKEMLKKSALPTLSEVARQAGVGTTTVSRVINGGDRVSPKTLARVRGVIETLGYTPNQAARILKGDRTRTIGLIVPSIADPFFSSCAEAAQAIARMVYSLLRRIHAIRHCLTCSIGSTFPSFRLTARSSTPLLSLW